MSNPKKIQGGATSAMPLSRLKQETPANREWAFHLAEQKNPKTGMVLTNTECRALIKERLGIALGSDGSYSDFRSWQLRQRQYDMLADLSEQDETTFRDRFPGLSADKIRDLVIKRQFAVAELLNDPSHTLKVIKTSQAESTGRTKAELEKEKLALAKEAEARQRAEHLLNREKFELDAVARAREHAKEIRSIEASSKISDREKINAIRQRLFGALPPA